MSQTEAQMYAAALIQNVDRIVDTLHDLSEEELDATPPVPGSNSVLVLAVHTMANVEENIFEVLGGEDVGRDRESEFRTTSLSADDVAVRWIILKAQVNTFLDSMPLQKLDAHYEHYRRGRMTGREVLHQATTHAAEHVGHAELTRDWIVASR